MVSEVLISTALLLTSVSLVLSPFIYRIATNSTYKRRTKKLLKTYKENLQKIEKEFEQKKAELENTVKAYDEKFKTVHQLFTELSTITDTQKEKENPKVYIAAKKSFEKNIALLKKQINE